LAPEPTRSAQLAAKELQHHIQLATGARVAIVRENEAADDELDPIYVGDGATVRKMGLSNEDFKTQGYLVKVSSDSAVLVGHDYPDYGKITYEKNGGWPEIDPRSPKFQVGTLYAVYDFLERVCGVRWYMVTDLGTVCPSTRTLAAEPTEWRARPWTTMRLIGHGSWAKPGSFGKPDLMGYVRNRNTASARDCMLYRLRMRYNGSSFTPRAHSLHNYYKIYGKKHPDWFVGSAPGRNVQLRYWKDEVVAEVAKNIIDYFSMPWDRRLTLKRDAKYAGGQGDVFAIGPHDNRIFGPDCQPPEQPERTGGFADGRYSNYWFSFVNRVARQVKEAHPDKWIASPAYASHFEPPESDMEPNVGVCMANTEGWEVDSYGMRNLEAWSRKVKRLFVYDYWYSKGRFPQVRPHAVAAYITRCRELKVEGLHMEMISNSNAALYHLDYYVSMRLLFDTNAEAAGILDEYYRLFYGPAEVPMRDFWTAMADYREKVASLGIRDKFWYVISMTRIVDRLDAHLDKAAALAQEEPYSSRVQVIRTGVLDMMRDRIAFARIVENTPVPVLEVKKTGQAPVLDGKLDDAVWAQTPAAPSFCRQKGGHGWRTPVTERVMEPCPDTIAKVAWDGGNLYLGLLFRDDRMDRLTLNQKHSSSGICLDDSLELAIDPGRRLNKRDYVHVMMNANDVFWLQWTRYGWCKPVPVDLRIRGKAWCGEDRWTAEVVVPLTADLTDGLPPKPGDEWGLNMMRNRTTGKNRAFWAQAFRRGGFHVLHRFGILRFTD